MFPVEVETIVESPTRINKTPDDLYHSFIQIQNYSIKNPKEDDVAELADKYEITVEAHLQVLMNLKARRSLAEDDSHICKKLEVMLREERNSWRLAKALIKDQLLAEECSRCTLDSDRMDDSSTNGILHMSHHDEHSAYTNPHFSEGQMIDNFYEKNSEIRRMQAVTDWLELNARDDLDYKEEEDKVEFYSDGPTAWENTFHAMRANYHVDIDISDLDITVNPNARLEICSEMDPDAPIRTKKSLVHMDKEVELRLFKHLFRFIRAGKLGEGQELAQRIGYHWLAGFLDGWLPYTDPNLDEENLGTTAIHQPADVKAVLGNKKRDIWKQSCFVSSKVHGLASFEKAILGIFGGNLKSVLPVCNTWADQLWARLRCSIDVKIESALRPERDNNIVPQDNRYLTDHPQEFYDNYQDIQGIFKSIKELKILSAFKEETIHQAVQKHLILNDINGLLNQLEDWCRTLEYDDNLAQYNEAISPHFLRFFAHIVLLLRELQLVTADDPRGTKIIESYIGLLIQQKWIESVAYYTIFLPKDNQVVTFARLLATINDRKERKQCLNIAREARLNVDEITQTVVELIREEPSANLSFNASMSEIESTKITTCDKRKIDSLDYLLYLESKNYIAILHHGLILLRYFALQRKMDAVKETFFKLPENLSNCVEKQWTLHTNGDITPSIRNNLRELEGFRVILDAQEELTKWSEWHHKKPEEPKKPANLSKFCDNVNYEQRLKQYQQDLQIWTDMREIRTQSLSNKITEMLFFPGGWMIDLPTDEHSNEERLHQLRSLRKIYIPQMTSIWFNILHLAKCYEECLKISHFLVDLKLYEEFTKEQVRDFLDKIIIVVKCALPLM